MKKIISILLCLVLMLSLLAGCGKKGGDETTEHKHTYESDWSHDESNHWRQANCEHNTLQANLGEHVDENLDGICDICEYDYSGCQHTYAAVWSSDATGHWKAATCNHIGSVSEKADHTDEDNDGACDVCGYMGDHVHSFEENWNYNDTQHWHDANCGHNTVDQLADHEDVTNDGVCDVCGCDFSGCEHTFSEEWRADVTYHWHPATCEHIGAVSGKEQHVDADENGRCDGCDYLMCNHTDFDLDGECDICGGPLDPDHVHEFGEEIGSNVTSHWYISTCHPGATSEPEDHVDENNDGVCDICAFQICGHSFSNTWTSNDTHHWHAILCTCSIARKDYAEHVDADGDGGCDVCMYGLPVEACYEVVMDNAPFTMTETGMITFAPVTINFPQAGKYVITPSDVNVRVWLTDGSDSGNEDAFYNSGSSLTLEVAQAGEMTLYFRYFDMGYTSGKQHSFAYSVTRMDDLVIKTMQGKVELPANTRYTLMFQAPQIGTYKLITGVDGLVIGLTEDSMEYYKGHIEFTVENVGDIVYFYLEYNDESVKSFIFDWQLVEPFCLSVSEGYYAVDVAPNRVDYKIEFTAPAAGYYLLSVNSEWLTFCEMGDTYAVPVRLETTQVLTPYMEAGQVYTTWLQTVYNYPAATNVYDTLTVSNVGELLGIGYHTVHPGAEGSRFSFQATQDCYYRIQVYGGELGVVASNGTVTWTSNAYEVNMTAGNTYVFMLRGSGYVDVDISTVVYSVNLANGTNNVTLEPNKLYNVNFKYNASDGSVEDMDSNSVIALSWEGSLNVYVNGEEYQQGSSLSLLNNTVTILVKSNGAANVKITVTVLEDANDREVDGVSEAQLTLNQTAILAVNRDGDGAKATFTAETGGTYTLTTYDAKAMIYVVAADGTKTQVLVGAGDYSFQLDGGQTIEFYVQTTDASAASISVVVAAGR